MFWNRNKPAPRAEPVIEEPERKAMKINAVLLAQASVKPAEAEFVKYEPPAGVVPEAEKSSLMAMDSTPYEFLNSFGVGLGYQAFPGSLNWPCCLNTARWSPPSLKR
jgi:hypothetical protein